MFPASVPAGNSFGKRAWRLLIAGAAGRAASSRFFFRLISRTAGRGSLGRLIASATGRTTRGRSFGRFITSTASSRLFLRLIRCTASCSRSSLLFVVPSSQIRECHCCFLHLFYSASSFALCIYHFIDFFTLHKIRTFLLLSHLFVTFM